MPAVLTLPGMESVTVQRDVVYKSVAAGDPPDLKADVYVPAGATASSRYPAVLLISGGGVEAGPGRDWRDAGVYTSYGGCWPRRALWASRSASVEPVRSRARGIVRSGSALRRARAGTAGPAAAAP
jgi:hypothetical protein